MEIKNAKLYGSLFNFIEKEFNNEKYISNFATVDYEYEVDPFEYCGYVSIDVINDHHNDKLVVLVSYEVLEEEESIVYTRRFEIPESEFENFGLSYAELEDSDGGFLTFELSADGEVG